MAEAAGLALGIVALASLFTTCVELIDYFELSKSYEYDYMTACLKLSLLKSRLHTWGHALQPGADSCQLDEELGHQRSLEKEVIRRSLQGIADILGSAEALKDKYGLSSRKSAVVVSGCRDPPVDRKSQRFLLSRIRGMSSVRRTTTWAIRDKQKFDNLISDLEFFISNLEVFWPCEHTLDMIDEANQPKSAAKSRNTTNSQASSSAGLSNQSVRRMNPLPSTSPAMMLEKQDSQQSAVESPTAIAKSPYTSRSVTEQRYKWSIDKMEDRSGAFFGTVGGATLAPAPVGQVVAFRVGLTTGDARVMGGAMSSDSFNTFFNSTARQA